MRTKEEYYYEIFNTDVSSLQKRDIDIVDECLSMIAGKYLSKRNSQIFKRKVIWGETYKEVIKSLELNIGEQRIAEVVKKSIKTLSERYETLWLSSWISKKDLEGAYGMIQMYSSAINLSLVYYKTFIANNPYNLEWKDRSSIVCYSIKDESHLMDFRRVILDLNDSATLVEKDVISLSVIKYAVEELTLGDLFEVYHYSEANIRLINQLARKDIKGITIGEIPNIDIKAMCEIKSFGKAMMNNLCYLVKDILNLDFKSDISLDDIRGKHSANLIKLIKALYERDIAMLHVLDAMEEMRYPQDIEVSNVRGQLQQNVNIEKEIVDILNKNNVSDADFEVLKDNLDILTYAKGGYEAITPICG